MTDSSSSLRIVIVGHVDHGKSTLIGRLLNDTDSLPEGKLAQVEEQSRKRGMPFEWAFVMDALQAERDQGITIDTTQIHFRTEQRPYTIIDAPGHTEFLRNMVTGAAGADAALLLIDVREGALEQSRRHAFLLHLLGVRQVAVVVNKMDAVGFDRERFAAVSAEITAYLGELGLTPAAVIPVSARHGHNIVHPAPETGWYNGPTVVAALDAMQPRGSAIDRPLRFPIQDVYKDGDRRILAGRIESGRIRVGDTLTFAPGEQTAQVVSIEAWNHDQAILSAVAGQSIGITIDRRLFVERGHIAAHPGAPIDSAHRASVRLFWLAPEPLTPGRTLTLKIATAEHRVTVERIEAVVDIDDLSKGRSEQVRRNDVAEVALRVRTPIAIDRAADLPATGRGVLLDGHDVVGGCIVLDHARGDGDLHAVAHAVTLNERAAANGHRGGVVWLTGLSGAGKSTLAMALERALFERGWQSFVLDGDGVRKGLGAGLGFSEEDRAENVRRTAEAARLFADAGLLTIVSLISPARADRARARDIVGDGFVEVYVSADLSICEARDPKGLYRKARAGNLPSFTGIGAPYEPPERADVTVDTGRLDERAALSVLLDAVVERFGARGRAALDVG